MFWNINEGLRQFHSFKAHELQISSIMKATNSDGRYLITSSWDGLVKMWKGAIKQ
jgi:WD40 repeat protein